MKEVKFYNTAMDWRGLERVGWGGVEGAGEGGVGWRGVEEQSLSVLYVKSCFIGCQSDVHLSSNNAVCLCSM